MLENGETIKAVSETVGFNRNTLSKIIKEYDLKPENYMRPSNRKFVPTKDQLETIESMLKQKKKYKEIAETIGVNRNLIPSLVDEYSLKAKHPNNLENKFSEDELNVVFEMADEGFNITTIGRTTGIDKSTVSKILQKNNKWVSSSTPNKDRLRHYEELCKNIVLEEIALNTSFAEKDLEEVKRLIHVYPVSEISDMMMKDYEELRYVIWRLRLTKYLYLNSIRKKPYSEQFQNDLANPELSNLTVGRKYGVSGQTISDWRKKTFGDFETRINVWLNKSTAEIEFEKILNELDLAFIYQKNICGYRCDYYLGHKLVVEVNGDYWHSEEINKKSDPKKNKVLTDNGYKVVYVWESELKDHKTCKEKIRKEFLNAIINF